MTDRRCVCGRRYHAPAICGVGQRKWRSNRMYGMAICGEKRKSVSVAFFWRIVMSALFCCGAAADAQPNITIAANRTNVSVGEQIQLTVRIVSGKRIGQITPPPPPASEFFTVVQTSQDQSQSTSISVINGRMEQKTEITYFFYYFIVVQKEGSFTFPSLQFTVDGVPLATEPIVFNVSREPVHNPDVVARLSLNKSELYVGEQGILTLTVLVKGQSPVQLTNEGFSACIAALNKALEGSFTLTPLFKEITGTQERYGGEIYRAFRARFALFPLNAGSVRIPPVPFQYIVQKRVQASRRFDPFFDDFFGGFFGTTIQQVPQSVMTNAVSLNVKSLPPAPSDFSGAVGNGFSLSADVDPKSVAAGDAVTLKVILRGPTRPGSLGEITLPPMKAFEAFSPEKTVAVDTTDNGLFSRRAYKYLLIAQVEGRQPIAPIRWSFFDPIARTYRTLTSESLYVDVTKGKERKKDATRYLTQAEIREIGRDIRYIKTTTRIKNQPAEPYKNPVFFILYPLPFLEALFAFLYRVQSRRRCDVTKMLRSRALSRARRELARVQKRMTSSSQLQLLSDVALVIERYISHRFGFPAAGRTLEQLRQELATRGVDERVVADLAAFIETMDLYRFGGSSNDVVDKKAMIEKTAAFVEQLERASAKKGKR